jgi:hypothetical protein
MIRQLGLLTLAAGVILSFAILVKEPLRTVRADDNSDNDQMRAVQGLAISPVPLKFAERNRQLVGLGSYLVNAVGSCNDCHTCPSYKDNPFAGDPGVVNADPNPALNHFLGGGRAFGPVTVSANLTPDLNGNPALTFSQFVNALRFGKDPDPTVTTLLQVMPWPVTRHMVNGDLAAIYAYLTAIPHATVTPGVFGGTTCKALN